MGKQFKATVSEIPRDIPLNEIFENPQNPRKYFDEIQELADNIKAVGLLQPIRVRPVDGGHQIIHGHRRYRAVEMLGWETIPATVTTMSDHEAFETSLSENLLRADLSAIEEAEGFQRLIDEYGYTQRDIAQKFGKSQQFVSSRLVLLKLPESVKEKITTRVVKASHGELLAKIDDTELQIKLALEIVQNDFSIRELERRIKDLTPEPKNEQLTIDAIGEPEEQSEPSESGEQESIEQPQEAEVIEAEEPEQANDETKTQDKSKAEENEQLTLIPKSQEEKSDSSQSKFENKDDRKDSSYLPSELLILACLDEQLQEGFKENLAQLNDYTYKIPRQENVDDAIKICGEIKEVALSMRETLEKSKAA